jgi:hypothetical protein
MLRNEMYVDSYVPFFLKTLLLVSDFLQCQVCATEIDLRAVESIYPVPHYPNVCFYPI